MQKSPMKPGKTLPVLFEGMERRDAGRKVVVSSVGGPVEGHDLQKLRHQNKDSVCNQDLAGWNRGVSGEPGTVVDGPYRIVCKAKRKKRTPNGRIARDKFGKIRYEDHEFVTNPYWLVRLDANGFCLHFVEDEIAFLG